MYVVTVIQHVLTEWMHAIALVIGGRDGPLEEIKTPLGRVIGNLGFFCGILIMSLYTANLAAFMTVANIVNQIKGVDDLKKTEGAIAIRCPANEPPPSTIANGGNFITEYLWKNHRDLFKRAVCYDSRVEMAEAVRAEDAIAAFDDAGMLQYIAKHSDCELETVGD